jgi:hypothetical protein
LPIFRIKTKKKLYLFKKCDKIHNFYALCSNFIKINALIKM